MKKIRLNLDKLAVETFETVPEAAIPRGTVRGLSGLGCSTIGTCADPTISGEPYCLCPDHDEPDTVAIHCVG